MNLLTLIEMKKIIHWSLGTVQLQWVSVSYKGQNVVYNRKLIKGSVGLNIESSKTYAEPLQLA